MKKKLSFSKEIESLGKKIEDTKKGYTENFESAKYTKIKTQWMGSMAESEDRRWVNLKREQ